MRSKKLPFTKKSRKGYRTLTKPYLRLGQKRSSWNLLNNNIQRLSAQNIQNSDDERSLITVSKYTIMKEERRY